MTITSDIWTDIVNTTSYLGMTVHFLNTDKLSLENVTIGVLELAVPSERLFSKAGNIMSAKRNRLKGEKLQHLLFLSSLNLDDWHLK